MYLNLTIEDGQTKSLAIDGKRDVNEYIWFGAIAVCSDATFIML
ncbi:hypothetical protein [Chamaesiphon minutus]|nr:hypothetical protein [Chamaesiphon minutus]